MSNYKTIKVTNFVYNYIKKICDIPQDWITNRLVYEIF